MRLLLVTSILLILPVVGDVGDFDADLGAVDQGVRSGGLQQVAELSGVDVGFSHLRA